MYTPEYLKHEIYYEVIKHNFNYWSPQPWNKHLKCIVYDSEIYSAGTFSIVTDANYNIILWGWDLSEAYYESVQAPRADDALEISYIRDYDTDEYIFFGEKGNILNRGHSFDKYDNMDREIVARDSESGKWFAVRTDRLIPEEEIES